MKILKPQKIENLIEIENIKESIENDAEEGIIKEKKIQNIVKESML